jgi:hypothetical protein
MADIDKAVNLLAFARQHKLSLTAMGDKLQIQKESRDENANLDIIVSMLATNKADVIAILQDPDAIKQWLGNTQKTLSTNWDALSDGIDRWVWAEEMYHKLFPNDQGCVCPDGYCIETALVTCETCVRKEKDGSNKQVG